MISRCIRRSLRQQDRRLFREINYFDVLNIGRAAERMSSLKNASFADLRPYRTEAAIGNTSYSLMSPICTYHAPAFDLNHPGCSEGLTTASARPLVELLASTLPIGVHVPTSTECQVPALAGKLKRDQSIRTRLQVWQYHPSYLDG